MMIGRSLTPKNGRSFGLIFPPVFAGRIGGYLHPELPARSRYRGNAVDLMHREVLIRRAHQGRFLTYSAVWDQDFTALFERIEAPLLLMCAEKDVLWPFFERACDMRTDAQSVTVGGSNFEPDQDPAGVTKAVLTFLNDVSSDDQET